MLNYFCYHMYKKFFIILTFFLLALDLLHAENNPYRSDYVWVVNPDHANWHYVCGETARVIVRLYEYGLPAQGSLQYSISPDMLPAQQRGEVILTDGCALIEVPGRATPGFTDIELVCGNAKTGGKYHFKLGYDPEQIRPWTREPDDFMTWWQLQIEALHKLPLQYTLQPAPEYTNQRINCQLLRLQVDAKHVIYGYLFIPNNARPGSCPAVLCPPGAGIKTIKDPMRHSYYAEQGFIRLEMEIHGLDPRMDERYFREMTVAFNAADNGYLTNGMEDRERYYMRHVYLSLVRAIDLLCSLPEWDGKNLVMQGGSQGGALAMVASALDSRVTACAANHPALTDMGAYSESGRTGGYPHFNRIPDFYTEAHLRTMAYYDVINFARHITCPVFLTWGYCDSTCPPTTSWAAYNTLTCTKMHLITPTNEHWVSDRTEHKQLDWFLSNLR